MARLNASSDNFILRGQAWDHFWFDAGTIVTENNILSDSPSSLLISAASIIESGMGTESPSALQTASGIIAEIISAIDSPNSSITTPVSEVLSAIDSTSATRTQADSVTETANSTDSLSASFSAIGLVAEALLTLNEICDAIIVPGASHVDEVNSMVDSLSAMLIASASIVETATALSSENSISILDANISEEGNASDNDSGVLILSRSIEENLNAVDNISGAGVLSVSKIESLSIIENASSVLITNVSREEIGNSSDLSGCFLSYNALISESLNTPSEASSMSRIANANILEQGMGTAGNGKMKRWDGSQWKNIDTLVVFK